MMFWREFNGIVRIFFLSLDSLCDDRDLSFFFFFSPPFPPPSFRELLFPLKSRYTLFFFHQNDEANLNEKGDR